MTQILYPHMNNNNFKSCIWKAIIEKNLNSSLFPSTLSSIIVLRNMVPLSVYYKQVLNRRVKINISATIIKVKPFIRRKKLTIAEPTILWLSIKFSHKLLDKLGEKEVMISKGSLIMMKRINENRPWAISFFPEIKACGTVT